MRINTTYIAFILFIFSIVMLSFGYGVAVGKYQFFPYQVMRDMHKTMRHLLGKGEFWYRKFDKSKYAYPYDATLAYQGLNLVTAFDSNDHLVVKVVDMVGKEIHRWPVDWFDIWPDATHLPAKDKPKSGLGAHTHGVVLLENGDLFFNYEGISGGFGLVKLDVCGQVVWRLPYRTHHSIYLDEKGHLWVSAQKNHEKPIAKLPDYKTPFIEPTILEVTQAGEVIQEISVLDLLLENGRKSLLLTTGPRQKKAAGDTLHLNDVETFPADKAEGFFKKGDVLVSLRNVSTVFAFDPATRKIKFLSIGNNFTHQHDPDFIDGNTISIFDNNSTSSSVRNSRILTLSVLDNNPHIAYSGSKTQKFYTHIMGKHQWLPNGNLLISEAINGRAFEITQEGKIVWQYFNEVEKGIVGLMTEVQRLPPGYQTLFNHATLSQRCGS